MKLGLNHVYPEAYLVQKENFEKFVNNVLHLVPPVEGKHTNDISKIASIFHNENPVTEHHWKYSPKCEKKIIKKHGSNTPVLSSCCLNASSKPLTSVAVTSEAKRYILLAISLSLEAAII